GYGLLFSVRADDGIGAIEDRKHFLKMGEINDLIAVLLAQGGQLLGEITFAAEEVERRAKADGRGAGEEGRPSKGSLLHGDGGETPPPQLRRRLGRSRRAAQQRRHFPRPFRP